MMTENKPDLAAAGIADRPRVFIGGRWVDSAGDAWIDVVDPSTEEEVVRVRAAVDADVTAAVTAARRSFDSGDWADRSIAERAAVLDLIANRLEARINELATIGVLEVGVPLLVSTGVQQMSVGLFRAVAAEARAWVVEEERPRADGGTSLVRREPTGVVAAIIPWNGPLGTIAFKVAPALAAGCSVILKGAPDAPLSVSAFADVVAELVEEGHIPEGVVSVLVADRETSEGLVTDDRVDHISFTGSTAAGRRIAALAAERIAKVSLELGGKSAAIVLDDADLGAVLAALPMGGCMQSGQACVALTRILVSESRHDEVVAALGEAFAALPIGDPWGQTSFLGPLAGRRHRDRVLGYIDRAVADGATVVTGGGAPAGLERGYFVAPTLLDGVRPDMEIAREEVFGPVVAVITYRDTDDAVAIANGTIYGLNGAVFTADEKRGIELARRIRSGTVSVNGSVIDFTLPFGGYKQSGLGREGGVEGLAEFFETKTVHLPA